MSASPWLVRATGCSFPMVFDADEARRALALFADPSAGCELVAIRSGACRVFPGADPDAGVAALLGMPAGQGLYFRLNPVPANLTRPARVADVLRRRWLYVDADPLKDHPDADAPATDGEKAATRRVCDRVFDHLSGLGWPAPVVTDSGNGYGLFWRVDLPNDAGSRAATKALLKALAERFSGADGVIDSRVYDATRLAKAPGTWSRKGEESDGRPHRPCRLYYVPAEVVVVPAALFYATAGVAGGGVRPAPAPATPTNGSHSAYARAALDAECAKVALSRPTSAGGEGRNNVLNEAAFSLGTLVGGGALDAAEVESRLLAAAASAGLMDGEARKSEDTLRRALGAGRAKPRGVPEPKGPTAFIGGGPVPDGGAGTPPPGDAGESWSVVIDGEVVEDGHPSEFLPEQPGAVGKGRAFEFYTLAGLMSAEFPEPNWAVPGLLSEGLNILAGKPKMGKSMMALNLGMTVAGGGRALGNMDAAVGDVLYLSLEDRSRRIQARARKMLRAAGAVASERLTIATSWPRQGQGGLELIDWWMRRVRKPTMVVIDVWGKFRPPGNPKANAYSQDYEHMTPLKELMDRHACCGLALMHVRKGASEDVLDDISGTLGLSGSADGIIVLQRARNDNEAKIYTTGRDVGEKELALRFDESTLTWVNLGPAEAHVEGKVQTLIVDYLRKLGPGASAFVPDIAAGVDKPPDTVRRILHRLFNARVIRRVGKAWAYPADDVNDDAL